jgi:hypothetical protein
MTGSKKKAESLRQLPQIIIFGSLRFLGPITSLVAIYILSISLKQETLGKIILLTAIAKFISASFFGGLSSSVLRFSCETLPIESIIASSVSKRLVIYLCSLSIVVYLFLVIKINLSVSMLMFCSLSGAAQGLINVSAAYMRTTMGMNYMLVAASLSPISFLLPTLILYVAQALNSQTSIWHIFLPQLCLQLIASACLFLILGSNTKKPQCILEQTEKYHYRDLSIKTFCFNLQLVTTLSALLEIVNPIICKIFLGFDELAILGVVSSYAQKPIAILNSTVNIITYKRSCLLPKTSPNYSLLLNSYNLKVVTCAGIAVFLVAIASLYVISVGELNSDPSLAFYLVLLFSISGIIDLIGFRIIEILGALNKSKPILKASMVSLASYAIMILIAGLCGWRVDLIYIVSSGLVGNCLWLAFLLFRATRSRIIVSFFQ